MSRLSLVVRREVAAQFQFRCAYCRSQEAVLGMRFTVDHIVPEVLGGSDDPGNLCLACWECNLTKGTRVAANDPHTHDLVALYHPRRERWRDHFAWQEGILIEGRTATGRATIGALELNRAVLIYARRRWVEVGWHPPPD